MTDDGAAPRARAGTPPTTPLVEKPLSKLEGHHRIRQCRSARARGGPDDQTFE
jgi:hypothetical protein